MSWLKADAGTWVWRVLPIGSVLVSKVVDQLSRGILWRALFVDLSLLAGWIVGWLIVEADHLFYATMCNPQELTCQRVKKEFEKKDLKRMWGILQETKFERTKLPIRNVLTGFVMTGLGIWVVISSGNVFASGLVFGFGIRLLSEFLADRDYRKWYWIFAREFSESEHRGIVLAWMGGLIWQWLALLRG
jgi:hypothetical protein